LRSSSSSREPASLALTKDAASSLSVDRVDKAAEFPAPVGADFFFGTTDFSLVLRWPGAALSPKLWIAFKSTSMAIQKCAGESVN
jgi:hypothetical protein